MTKNSRQKFKYLENEKSFQGEMKSICIFFKGLSVAKSCLRPDSVPLKADQQISKKGCLKKYYSCDRACQVSALEGTP